MKMTLAYLPEEEERAAVVLAALLRAFPDTKVKKSNAHPPFRHIYLSTPKLAKT